MGAFQGGGFVVSLPRKLLLQKEFSLEFDTSLPIQLVSSKTKGPGEQGAAGYCPKYFS